MTCPTCRDLMDRAPLWQLCPQCREEKLEILRREKTKNQVTPAESRARSRRAREYLRHSAAVRRAEKAAMRGEK